MKSPTHTTIPAKVQTSDRASLNSRALRGTLRALGSGKKRYLLPAVLGLLVSSSSPLLARANKTYQIEYNCSNGTDSYVYFTLYGENGSTSEFECRGDKEAGAAKRHEYVLPDIGPATGIRIRVKYDDAIPFGLGQGDDWAPIWIKVYYPNPPGSNPHTISEFTIGDLIGQSKSRYYSNPQITGRPSVTVSKTGKVIENTVQVTVANLDVNDTEVAQPVMRFKESWSFALGSGITTTTTTGTQTTASLTAGVEFKGFSSSLGLSQAWSDTFSTQNSQHQQNVTSSEFDWEYLAPPYTTALRKVTFTVPYEYAHYASSDGKDQRWIRIVGGRMSKIGTSSVAQVPKRGSDGKVVPLSWDYLNDEYAPHLSADMKALLLQLAFESTPNRKSWLEQGFIYQGSTPPPATPAVTLKSGVYKDSHGDYVEVHVSGDQISVTAYSNIIRKYWQTATGKLLGSKVTDLKHKNNGQVTGIGSGTVSADGRRIDFTNGTHWSYFGADLAAIPVADRNPSTDPVAPNPSTPAVALKSGIYKDSHGDYVEVSVNAGQVSVTAYSDVIRKYWQTASGSLAGTAVTGMQYKNNGSVVGSDNGTVTANGQQIAWNNGTKWSYFGADLAEIPVADKNPGDSSPDPTTDVAAREADLTGEFTQTQYKDGKLTCQLVVTNKGNSAASASFIRVFASLDRGLDRKDDVSIGSKEVPALRAGESTTINIAQQIQGSALTGRRLIASLDHKGQVAESDETNNTVVDSRRFGSGGPNKADDETKGKGKGKGKKGDKNKKGHKNKKGGS